MKRPRHCNRAILTLLLVVCVIPALARAQPGEADLKVYGYLQASFYYQMNKDAKDTSTFTVQQLDIMLQKDLSRRWSAFVDLLITNSYSSFRNVGTLELEQAWVRYRRTYLFNVKLGLLIPRFNYLNEIRNKMPILPYVIRPIVYETSFKEDVNLEEFVPQSAYVQVYGYAPVNDYKIEYAAYLGNSPNVNSTPPQQTGLDTTTTFLVGGRVGIRSTSFELGFSATRDKVDFLSGVDDEVVPPLRFEGITRVRWGSDASLDVGNFSFKGEFIYVDYGNTTPVSSVDKRFAYGTAGYRFRGSLFAYVGYWWLDQNLAQRTQPNDILTAEWKLRIPNAGVAYQMSDRIVFKGAVARVAQNWSVDGLNERTTNFFACAVSVTF